MKSTALIAFASVALMSACASQPPAEPAPKAMQQAPAIVSPMAQLKDQLGGLQSMGLTVEDTADALRVTMPGAMAFASGSSAIDPAAREALDRIATAMTAVSQGQATVVGHTDSAGSSTYNQSLSEARAQSVVAYIAGKGVDTARLIAEGRGEDEPVADNATADGRAANRRVELLISVR